jgi:hypothetical protein
MARAEAVTLAIMALGQEQGQPLGLGYGPHQPSQWAGQTRFLENLRAFWAALVCRDRERGERGTTWVELWIAYEMEHGSCPRAARGERCASPLEP